MKVLAGFFSVCNCAVQNLRLGCDRRPKILYKQYQIDVKLRGNLTVLESEWFTSELFNCWKCEAETTAPRLISKVCSFPALDCVLLHHTHRMPLTNYNFN